MSTELLEPYTPVPAASDLPREDFEQYRALSAPAVVAFVLGILGLSGFVFPALLVISAIAMGVSLYAVWSISRSAEYSGKIPAWLGLGLSLAALGIGGPFHAYVYATEVPPGFERVSFADLQPAPNAPVAPTAAALALNGQKVFIKGYIHPLAGTGKIKQFVMVPDMGTCCFGGQPKLTDMIEVTLSDPLRTQYSAYKRKFAGTLRVHQHLKTRADLEGVFYELEAEYLD